MFSWFKKKFSEATTTVRSNSTETTIQGDNFKIVVDGKVIYDGPRSKVPPELWAQVKRQFSSMKQARMDLIKAFEDLEKELGC